MSWLSVIPAFLAAVAVLFLPGLALAAAVGARRFLLIAVAPGVTIAFLAVLAVLLPWIGVGWSLVPIAAALIVVTVLAWLIRHLVLRKKPIPERAQPTTDGRWIAIAMVIGGLVLATQLILVIGVPDHISQTFDANFHLNTLQYINSTGNASSLHVSQLVLPPQHSSFYPAAWHDFVSVVVELTGVSIPVAVTVSNIAIAAIVWPASVILLARTLIPRSRAAIVSAGILCAAFPNFPLLMLSYGVLYPYFLSLALLPLALALGISLVRRGSTQPRVRVQIAILLVAVLVAIGLAQPSSVFAWFAFMIPLLGARVIQFIRARHSTARRVAIVAAAVIIFLAFAFAWYRVGKLGANTPWLTHTNMIGGIYEALTASFKDSPPAILLTILTIVGIVHLVRTQGHRWFLLTWVIGVIMYVTVASIESIRLRTLVDGLFYRDPPRIAALLVIVTLPMAIFGAFATWGFIRDRGVPWITRHAGAGIRRGVLRGAALVGILLMLIATGGFAMQSAVQVSAKSYDITSKSPILSPDELTLIDRLDAEVPASAVIVGNPWTGTALAYALADRKVLNPHFNALIDGRAPVIDLKLNAALNDPAVCDAVRALNVRYVLDFGTYFGDVGRSGVTFNGTAGYTGLLHLARSGVVTEVDRVGKAVLYKITACGY